MTMTRRQRREEQQAKADMRELSASPAAQRFFMRLLGATGFNSMNPRLDGRTEGRREIGAWVLGELLTVNPMAYADLVRLEVMGAAIGSGDNEPEAEDE